MEEAVRSDIWGNALLDSLNDLVTGMLFLDKPELLHVTDEVPSSIQGAQVAMVSLQERLNIGLSADDKGCAMFARSLLGIEPDEEVSGDDIKEAMGEIVDIVAGGVKRKLVEEVPTLKIGLPVFFEGKISAQKAASSKFMEIKVGSGTIELFIILDSRN